MKYRCKTCGYTGQKFMGGSCPACRSFHVVEATPKAKPAPRARDPYRVAFLVVIWFYFGWLVFHRFIAN